MARPPRTLTLPVPHWPGLHVRYHAPSRRATAQLLAAGSNRSAVHAAHKAILASAVDALMGDPGDGTVTSLAADLGLDAELRFDQAAADALGLDVPDGATPADCIAALFGSAPSVQLAVASHVEAIDKWVTQEGVDFVD
ncbi:MAG TPA: hypothetical protein VF125_06020 [Solirubrobacterales bacterium]